MSLEACLQLSAVRVCRWSSRREKIASPLHRAPSSKGPASGISSHQSSLLLSFLAPQRRWRRIHLVCCSENAVDEVIAVDDAGWENAVAGAGSGGSLVLVQFWAPLCGPCSMIEPVISELAKDYAGKLACYKVNTDASPNIATMCGVRSIPTLLFFKNGEKKESIIGAMPKAALRETIDKHLGL